VIDCVVNGDVAATCKVDSGVGILQFEGLSSQNKEIEIYLYQEAPIVIKELRIEDAADITPLTHHKPKWITYGSSITQCGEADSPALTWPAIVARRSKLDLTCLGYSGNCMLEPMVAKMIRDLPADYISLCLGINVYGQATLSHRTFPAAVMGMIQTIREKHRYTPIVVISPIFAPLRETKENQVGMTLVSMREQIESTIKQLQARGDDQLHYVHGLELFDDTLAEYLPDDLHPNAEGYAILAKRFEERIVKKLWGI
jgi:hypothetical protein